MARSEYSYLRGIAQRRIDRLIAQGLAPAGLRFPAVKELGSPAAQTKALASIKSFLASGSTLREARRGGLRAYDYKGTPHVINERQYKEQQRREKISRALKERNAVIRALTSDQRSALKGARSVGLNIKTNEIMAFLEYVEYRYSQNKDTSWYTIVDDFQTAQERKKTQKGSLVKDFAQYKSDRQALRESRSNAGGRSSAEINEMWADFVND